MLFPSQLPKRLPCLSAYVTRMAARSPESRGAQGAGCMMAGLTSAIAFVGLERIMPIFFAIALTLFIVLPLLAGLASVWVNHLSRPRNEDEERRREAHEAILFMNNALNKGKLHRRIDRAAGLLLEECARQWLRIHDAVSGTFWEDKDLPAHWKHVRDQSTSAANRAMDDLIVMLKPVLETRDKQTSTQEFIGDMLENVLNVKVEGPVEPLPAAFLPARDIAQKLMQLADEVEETTQRAADDPSFREHYSSATQIDHVLGELRAIKQAESELHQEIGRGPEE